MLRGQEVTEQDWRGILAIITTLGYFVVVSLAALRFDFTQTLLATSLLSTMETLVLNWYFRAQEAISH